MTACPTATTSSLTYLLFLKMADERSRPPYNQPSLVPADYAWPRLLALDGDDLFDHYRDTLVALRSLSTVLSCPRFVDERNCVDDPVVFRKAPRSDISHYVHRIDIVYASWTMPD